METKEILNSLLESKGMSYLKKINEYRQFLANQSESMIMFNSVNILNIVSISSSYAVDIARLESEIKQLEETISLLGVEYNG